MRNAFLRVASALVVLALFLCAAPAGAVSTTVVISQAYGGGGNSGSTWRNDFIELFNRGGSPVNLSGWTVQYASATGTSWTTTALTNVTLQPGQYYLVQEAAGAGGTTSLPTPDATGSINMSGTGGKVALVNTTTALSGACPTGATIVDFVGWASTANCNEGGTNTGAPSNTTAVLRNGNGCTDTDNNGADFTVGTPTPRNTSTALAPCGGPTNPSGAGSASPALGTVGATTLLTVTVTPGASPASTGLGVTVDLSGIGQSATQTFYDDGTNGDVTASDNVFSFQTTVGVSATSGPKSLPFTITDAESRTGTGTIAYTVAPTAIAIHDIQGNGTTSSRSGNFVATHGIVTALRSNGFYIQAPDAEGDGDSSTSEGVFVFTSSAPTVAVGNDVSVAGTVSEYVPTADPLSPPLTEITSPAVSVLSTTNPLPAPVVITASDTTANSIENLEKYEGMRVSIPSLTVVSPTQGTIDEANATSTPNGVFYGVITGVARPFREPGIQANDPLPSDAPGGLVIGPGGVPRFDFNPERIRVNMVGQTGGASIDVTSGATLTNLVGVLHYDYRTYTVYPDPSSPPTVTGNLTGAAPVTAPLSTEFTVATANLQHYYDTVNDPGSDVVLTAAAYARRLAKVSLAVRNVMRFPDILAVEEAEKLSVLTDLSAKISADALGAGQPDPLYAPYLQPGNDVSNINVGFLVKTAPVVGATPRVSVGSSTQYNLSETWTDPCSGSSTALLNDRPPLELVATINHANGGSLPVTLLVLHDKALTGVDDTTTTGCATGTNGNRNRQKRRLQAESVAALVQARQAQNLIVLGDFNAYEFNDGYVDVVGTIAGTSAPVNAVVLPSTNTVTPPLTVLDLTDPAADRYSYTYDGSAQAIDHILVSQALVGATAAARVERAHVNADFPESAAFRGDGTRPEKYADHDPAVAYFTVATFPVELTSFSAE